MLEHFIRPALLLAAEGGGQGGLLSNPDLWRVINLLVFVIALIYILRNKIRIGDVFDNRAASITRELAQARQDKQQAEERLGELEARLSRLDEEVAQIRADAERESLREADRIREAAAKDAEKIGQTAHREIEGAVRASRTELRAFVADHSVEMAEAIIRRELRPEDNSRMLNRYVEELDEVSK